MTPLNCEQKIPRHIPSEYVLLGIKNGCVQKHGKDLRNKIKFVRLDQDGIDVKNDVNGR